MKKITFLLTLLLSLFLSTGAWADSNAPKGYVSSIETGVNYLWCLYDAASNKARYIHADGTKTASYEHLTGAGIFQFEDAGEGYYYIKNVNSGNYMYTDYANNVAIITANGSPYAYTTNNVLSAGAKEDADKFKWLVSTGSTTNGFFISSKVNSNAVLAATGEGNTGVYFYQYTVSYNGNAKYPFANSKFLKVATSTNELNTSKCYNIYNNRAWWAVGNGATNINSTDELSLAVSTTDTKQQFAFINYCGKYYLYSVSAKKFAYIDEKKLSLAESPYPYLSHNVTFTASTNATYKTSAPTIVTIGSSYYGVSTGKSPDVFLHNYADDGGIASAIIEAGSFDPSEAIAKIEASFPFTSSTIESPIYYAMMISNNANSWFEKNANGTDVNCDKNRALPNGDASDWAWLLIGNATNGYKLYNKASGKYIGGQTTTGAKLTLVDAASAQSFYPVYNDASTCKFYDKTNNLWIDRSDGTPWAHTSGQKFTFQRLYKVKFAMSDENAGLQVGSEDVEDFNTEYVITTSASLSCVESGCSITAYDGYTTLADALENDADGIINLTVQKSITYKLNFNGSEITSKRTVRTETIGESTTSAVTVFGTAPVYCSFGDPDVSTIAATTTEVNVDLNWSDNAPFTFSADYENAVWYYMCMNNKWAVGYKDNSTGTQLQLKTNKSDAIDAGDKGLWAFTGNPYKVRVINKDAGSDKFIFSNATPCYFNSDASGYVDYLIGDNNNGAGFTLSDDNYYLADNNDAGYISLIVNAPNSERSRINVLSYYCQKLIDDLYDWADANHRDEYFGPSEAWLTSKESQIISVYPNMSKSIYDGITIPDDFLPIVPKYPATGFYRIKNNATNNYLAYGYASRSDQYTDRNGYGLIATTSTDAASVIRLTGSAGTYKISTQGLNVQSSTEYNKTFPASAATGADWVFEGSAGITSITNTASKADDNGHDGAMHEGTTGWNDNHHGIISWRASAPNSKWVVEDATELSLTLNDGSDGYYYGTLCVPFDITLSEACAYTLTLNDAKTGFRSDQHSCCRHTCIY